MLSLTLLLILLTITNLLTTVHSQDLTPPEPTTNACPAEKICPAEKTCPAEKVCLAEKVCEVCKEDLSGAVATLKAEVEVANSNLSTKVNEFESSLKMKDEKLTVLETKSLKSMTEKDKTITENTNTITTLQNEIKEHTSNSKITNTKLTDSELRYTTCEISTESLNKSIEHLTTKITVIKQDSIEDINTATKKRADSESKLTKKSEELVKLKEQLKALDDQLLGKGLPTGVHKYVNFTLIGVDSNLFYLKNKKAAAVKVSGGLDFLTVKFGKGIEASKVFVAESVRKSKVAYADSSVYVDKVKEVSVRYFEAGAEFGKKHYGIFKPYTSKVADAVQASYKKYAKDKVDNTIKPSYVKYIKPHFGTVQVKSKAIYTLSKPYMKKMKDTSVETFRTTRLTVVHLLKNTAYFVNSKIPALTKLIGVEDAASYQTRIVNSVVKGLTYVDANAEYIVTVMIKLIGGYLGYVYLLPLLRFTLSVALSVAGLVFRIVFWPFFIGGGKGKAASLKKPVAAANGANKVKVKKENGKRK